MSLSIKARSNLIRAPLTSCAICRWPLLPAKRIHSDGSEHILGTWEGLVRYNGREMRVFSQRDPAAITWSEAGVDVVIESTGRFTDRTAAEVHIAHGGAKRVKSLATLGTPHHGTPTALLGVAMFGGGLLSKSPFEMLPKSSFVRLLAKDTFPAQIPLTSIFSRTDLVCPYWSARLLPKQGEVNLRNVELTGLGHTELAYDMGVYRHVHEHLQRAVALWKERAVNTPPR